MHGRLRRYPQQASEVDARELTALIRIEDFGPAVTGKRLFDRLDAELEMCIRDR